MKTTRPQVLFSLVAACLAITALQANAQATVHYNDGDIFLGFRSTDGTNDYLVDLGQASQFRDAPPGSTVTFNLSTADLSGVFGSDWYTRFDPATQNYAVLWSVLGARQFTDGIDPNNTLYSTNPNVTPWSRHSNSTQGTTRVLVGQMGTTYDGNTSTNNTTNAIIQADNSANSYASFQPGGPNSGGVSFQTWNPGNEGSPVSLLYFNRIVPGTGPSQQIGTFTLTNTGTLTFTAVPEPSTIASLLAGTALLIAGLAVRRRTFRA